MSKTKLTIEKVKDYTRENSDCELLSNEYKNNKTKLRFRCKCGNYFESSFSNFKKGKQQCNECGKKLTISKKTLKIEDIKKFVDENSECELLTTEYTGICFKLSFRCKCGNKFKTTYSNFKNGKVQCNECSTFKLEKKVCPICKKEFRPRNSNTIYCSKECKCKSQEDRVYYNCEYCGKETFTKWSIYNKSEKHYCSRECSDLAQFKRIKYNCEYCGKECECVESGYFKHKHHFCNNECHGKYKMNQNITDEERERKRFRKEDKKWSSEIKRKFKGTCVICGKSKSKHIKIISHHLDGWNYNVSKRIDINNGVCLCENCHKEFHKIYGYGKNTREQFEEFFNDKTNKNKTA